MSYRLFSTGKASALFGDSCVIQAEEARVFVDAVALLESASALRDEAEAAHRTAVENGREEGRAAVFAERDAFAAEQLARALDTIVQEQARLRADIGTLALEALRHMLGELPAEIAVAGLVEKAVARLPVEAIERIAIAPALAEPVARRIDDALAVRVEADGKLGPGDCVIHAQSGRIIAHLDLQLERLAERWQASDAP